MFYHGVILSTTFLWHPKLGMRYTYVSDEKGWPVESIGRERWSNLKDMHDGKDGWLVLGTWPVAKHPENVWGLIPEGV